MDEKDWDSDKEAKKYTTDDFEVVKLLDPLAEERNALRYSLIPSMVKIYEYNKARENKDVCIFEIGKGFYKKQEEYGENQKIVALMTGKYYLGVGNSANVDFYVIKGVVEELLELNKYGRARLNYLKTNKKAEYMIMSTKGTLNKHLKEVQEIAEKRLGFMINELVKKEDITEELKQKNQLAWVSAMDSIKSIAEEIIYNELIYV